MDMQFTSRASDSVITVKSEDFQALAFGHDISGAHQFMAAFASFEMLSEAEMNGIRHCERQVHDVSAEGIIEELASLTPKVHPSSASTALEALNRTGGLSNDRRHESKAALHLKFDPSRWAGDLCRSGNTLSS
jgi:hypothetical protein